MALEDRSISHNKKFIKMKEVKEGQVLVKGHYIKSSINQFDKLQLDFRPEEPEEEGQIVALTASADIKRAVEQGTFVPGDYVVITFLGKETWQHKTQGPITSNRFKVQVDPEKHQSAVAGAGLEMKQEPVNIQAPQTLETAPKAKSREELLKAYGA